MMRWLLGLLLCPILGHRIPPWGLAMRELDRDTKKPNGRGLYVCSRCNKICAKT
jgi:hypothetical protein